MTDIRITDGGETKRAAERLRLAANGGLQRELQHALDRSTKRLDEDVRGSALERLPKRGGLNQIVARSRIDAEHLAPLRVRLVAKGIDQLKLINAGHVSHPTYGHRPRVFQSLPRAKNWFSRPIRRNAGRISRELRRAMERTARRITGK
ncbi:hypothetical protein [Kribbella sp. NPDC004536]|uniref:hypothetical protein n=1 Tax=Kribbella sp. NPDC004536 TaxID=3364106 RepID=UPI00367B44A2